MASSRCEAKNPQYCPYHGSPQPPTGLKERLIEKINGTPRFYPSFVEPGKPQVEIVITPNATNSKVQPLIIETEGESFQDLTSVVTRTLNGVRLKDLKTGYSAQILISSSDKKNAVPVKTSASTVRNWLDDEAITETGVEGMKQEIISNLSARDRHNKNFNEVMDGIKDSSIAGSTTGAKAIAVVEAMNEFSYFHLEDGGRDYEVQAAFNSLLTKTSEYTNRGSGIRVHLSYDGKGEIREAVFSLDEPNSRWNVFKNEDVQKVNTRLKKYFASLNQ